MPKKTFSTFVIEHSFDERLGKVSSFSARMAFHPPKQQPTTKAVLIEKRAIEKIGTAINWRRQRKKPIQFNVL